MTTRLSPRTGARLAVGVLAVGLVVAGAVLVRFARGLYFYGDDWSFLLLRGTVEGTDRGLWAPHNEHWSTLPVLLYRALFATVGLDDYLVFALPVILVHLALSALLYAVLVRLGSSRGPALVVALAVAFLGAGAENTLWDFQVGFVAPVALALLAVLAVRAGDRWPRPAGPVVAGVLLVAGLMCSGVGISAVVLVVGFVALTGGVRRAVLVGAGPTVAFLVWYAAIGHTGRRAGVGDRTDLLLVPAYVWTGLTSALERASAVDGSGPVLLAVLALAPLLVREVSPALRALAVSGVLTAVVQTGLQAVSRVDLGVEQAASGRYAYLTLVLLAPALAVVCGWLGRRVQAPRWPAAVLASLVAAGYLVHGVALQHQLVEKRQEVSPALERLVRGIQAVTPGDRPVLTEQPFPAYHPDITVSLLDSPEVRAALPARAVSPQTELDGLALVEVGVATESFGLPDATGLRPGPGLAPRGEPDGGCVTYSAPSRGAVLELDSPDEGAELRVSSDAGWVTTTLSRDGLRSLPDRQRIVPGTPVFVGVRVPGATLRASFDRAGSYEVCSGG
ncbi:hypothetical protein [uncultured Nocardioides sp.]|uniref:hypothetical protein n=1 Tax=uncultured Nocardioides sp. TaxID=198441 RepID=UPI0025ED7164|nr:hypothetical protein [uncultured Nocardioides sp.]